MFSPDFPVFFFFLQHRQRGELDFHWFTWNSFNQSIEKQFANVMLMMEKSENGSILEYMVECNKSNKITAMLRRVRDSDYLQYKIVVQSQIELMKKNYRDAILVASVDWLRMCVGTLIHWPDAMSPLKIVVLLRTSECHLKWRR